MNLKKLRQSFIFVVPLTLLLTSCSGPAMVSTPNVVGMTADQAQSALIAEDLTATLNAGTDSVWMPSNWTVKSQTPEAGTQIEEETPVVLIVEKTVPDAETPPSEPAEVVPAEPALASRVEASLKTQWGVTEFSDGFVTSQNPELLNWYIASVVDVSPGIIELYLQVPAEQTSEEEVKQLSRGVLTLTGGQIKDLEWVVVQTSDGAITEQSSRAEVAAMYPSGEIQ